MTNKLFLGIDYSIILCACFFSDFFFMECIMTFACETVMAHSVTGAISRTNFYILLQNYGETVTSV
jgi:hypothetical protein